jgi:hypothetical protein
MCVVIQKRIMVAHTVIGVSGELAWLSNAHRDGL